MITLAKTRQGSFLVLPNDSLGNCLLKKEDFEPHFYSIVKNIVKENDICIDCGANLGYHTVTLGKLVGPGGRVIAFEPQKFIYQQLNGNIFLNNLKNVTCVQAALGEIKGKTFIEYVNYEEENVNIGGTKLGRSGEQVDLISLDEKINSDIPISFIKFDIQGSEVNALNGAAKLIARCRPVMFVEVEDCWLQYFNTNSKALLDKIISYNYIVFRIDNEYPCDHLAIPVEREKEIPFILKDLNFGVTRIN